VDELWSTWRAGLNWGVIIVTNKGELDLLSRQELLERLERIQRLLMQAMEREAKPKFDLSEDARAVSDEAIQLAHSQYHKIFGPLHWKKDFELNEF